MAEIKVPDAVVELALSVFINHETGGLGDDEIPGCMRAALEAGLAAMLEPVGYLIQWDSDPDGDRKRVSEIPCHRDDGTYEQLYRIKPE
jgi:hypothetical protein